MKKSIYILFALAFFFASCKMRKKKITEKATNFETEITTKNSGSDSLLRKKWKYFSGRIAVDYVSNDQELSGNVSIRMQNDSILWFSVTAVLGIQVSKGIVTHDSIKILDLIEKKYSIYSIKELGKTFGAEITLRQLQNIILGNPVFDTLTYKQDIKTAGWFGVEHPMTNILYAGNFKSADSSFLVQKGSVRQLKTTYKGSKSAGAFNVANTMRILAFSASNTVRLDLEFTTASDAVIPSYPFAIPADYKQKTD